VNIFSRHGAISISYRLLADTAIDRFKRVEANTIITNFLMLLAFNFSIYDILFRMGITVYANVLAYFINDYIDIEIDLAANNKNNKKALFLKQHKHLALVLIICLITTLLIISLIYNQSVCFAVILVFFVIFIYTNELKKRPYLDIIGCFFWGISLPWIALPDVSWNSIKYILLLGLFSSCTEIVQCIKDFEFDKSCGVRTTPVVIGIQKSFIFIRLLFVVSAFYSILVLHHWAGTLLLLLIFLDTKQEMPKYWMKLRIVFGIVWLILMSQLYFMNI
jgi:4-hydroxybenzoate polyprenyltransferase